jgi:predicted glycosyl hydrolase (DUF1957 family)
MFEALPEISEGSYQTFVDTELLGMVNNINQCMDELRSSNKYLARAIGAGARTTAEGFDQETSEIVKADAVAAQLMVLRLVNRAIQAQQLEAHLLNQSTK